ncbi:MAG: class I SAM-dependent methyltransferase [Anaerolineae bacterium]
MSDKPPMYEWYTQYYAAVASSRANALYCERLAGRNLCQHDFTEMSHLDRIIEVTGMSGGQRVLDMGCGNGFIAEYLSDTSGANVTGVDFIPDAIRQAQERTRAKADRLDFRIGDMAHLGFPPASFEIIVSIDTLYFTPLDETVRQMTALLKQGGQMAIFYSYGREPWVPRETFPTENTLPDATPLARALRANGLAYETVDYTDDDYQHALRKRAIAEELHAAFEAEGNLFLYENHYGEAVGVAAAIEEGAHRRYLYHVRLPGS